jgi:hypothetical protein
MKWLLIQSNLILYIGMLIPLVGAESKNSLESYPQIKKAMEAIKASHKQSDPKFNYDNMEAREKNGKVLIYVPPKDNPDTKQWRTFEVNIKISDLK